MDKKLNVLRISSIFLISLFYLLSCQKEDLTPPENYESVVLKDLTGFDGCTLVFQKIDNKYLEPINLPDFNLQLEIGKEYWIQFETSSYGTYCMVGDVIQLKDVRNPFKY